MIRAFAPVIEAQQNAPQSLPDYPCSKNGVNRLRSVESRVGDVLRAVVDRERVAAVGSSR
jgi:hypothetical protein